MPKRGKAWCLAVCLLATTTLAAGQVDRVFLTDGRVLTGRATVGPSDVLLHTSYGVIRLPRHQVRRIEQVQTPQNQLEQWLATADRTDPNVLCAIARWAGQQDLPDQAQQLYREALARDPDHGEAREALGYLHLDGQWIDLPTAIGVLGARLTGGTLSEADPTVNATIERMRLLAGETPQRQEVEELDALWLLRQGKLDPARAAFAALAQQAQPPDRHRFEALAAILTENADGLYVLSEAYPPQAGLLGLHSRHRVLPAGPAPLTEPLALQAALRDRARLSLQQAHRDLEAGQAIELTDRPAAEQAYQQALEALDLADALVPEIGRGYRIELTRRRVALLRRDVETQATHFDAEMSTLGKQELTPTAYTLKLGRMIRHLSQAQEHLQAVQHLAQPFRRELVLEIRWADLDRQRIDAMLATLRQELHELR